MKYKIGDIIERIGTVSILEEINEYDRRSFYKFLVILIESDRAEIIELPVSDLDGAKSEFIKEDLENRKKAINVLFRNYAYM